MEILILLLILTIAFAIRKTLWEVFKYLVKSALAVGAVLVIIMLVMLMV